MTFSIGDRVLLTAEARAELIECEIEANPPAGVGVVVDIGFIAPDDVVVDFGPSGMQCDPDWLVRAEG